MYPSSSDVTESAPGPLVVHAVTDLGNARRLVDRHGQDLANVQGLWMVWDGRRWQQDRVGEVDRRAKDTAESIGSEAEQAPTEELRAQLQKHALKAQSAGSLKAMVRLASTEPSIVISPEELDRHPALMTVENGTVDLATGILKPHDRRDLITHLGPVPCEPDAECPLWERFIRSVAGGDDALERYLARLAGAVLLGRRPEQQLWILHGPGDNGKTTYIETIRSVMGEYAANAQMSTFMAGGRHAVRNDIARLAGKRLVTASEGDETQRLDEGLVKQLTGDDTMTARFLYREHTEFVPTFAVVFVTNHLPEIRGTDHAIWRRVQVVPFAVTIAEDERDPELGEKLKGELPGIFAWMVRGCLEYQRAGLDPPPVVIDRTRAYREDQDHVGRFLQDSCATGEGQSFRASTLYEFYRVWCDAVGEPPLSQKALGGKLTALGSSGPGSGRQRSSGRGFRLAPWPHWPHPCVRSRPEHPTEQAEPVNHGVHRPPTRRKG